MGPADEPPAQELTVAGHGGARAPSNDLPALPAPYQIESVIAQGGMGRIYRALDTDLGRAVAIKVPKSSSPGLLRRFEREVAITARLQHPGIVPIHGAGRLADGTPFYVMRFVEGTPLDAAVTRANDLAERLALVPHLVTVAATMGYVHGEHVAHRDLKPNNILIGRFGETVIIDWGLAKQLEGNGARPSLEDVSSLSEPRDAALDETSAPVGATTRAGDVLGTPSFMSPEQASGKAIDARADVYAIGVMLAFVVTGRIGDVDDDPAWRDPAAAPLVAVQRRATAANLDDRYADGGVLADALRAVLGRRAEPVGERSRWPRRAMLAACVLAVGGIGVAFALRSRTTNTAASPAHLERVNVSRDDLVNIALSPGGHKLATISLDRIEIRDLASGRTWSRPAWIAWPAQIRFESEDVVELPARPSRLGAITHFRWELANDTLSSRGAFDDSVGPWVGALAGADLFVHTHPSRPVVRVGSAEPKPYGLGRYPVGLIAIAPSRRAFAFVDPIDLVHVTIRVVEPNRDRVIESPPLADVGALTWEDDDTLLYATGSTGSSVLWRATVAGLATPTRLYTHDAPDEWIGAIAARGGRLFVSLTSSAFEARVLAVDTKRIDPLQATDAAAVLGWHDATTMLTWNRGTSAIERRSLDSSQLPAVTRAWFRGDPANATTAGDVIVIAQRGQNGRNVVAVDATTGSVRWQTDGGKLWFVRCAGDRTAPCVAGARTSEGLMELRRIDPSTGDLGDVVVAAANIVDAAIDAHGTRLAWIVDNAQLHTRALEATGDGEVFGNFTSAHSLAFVADRDELVVGGGVGDRGIAFVRGHDVTSLVTMPNELVSLVRASPDGSRVSFRARALTSQLAELRR